MEIEKSYDDGWRWEKRKEQSDKHKLEKGMIDTVEDRSKNFKILWHGKTVNTFIYKAFKVY